jgi:hypothetical protein
MPVVAAFSRYPAALVWAAQRLVARYGTIALASPPFDFRDTAYYEATMGAGLHKQFLAFDQLRDPASLVEMKLETNALEAEYAGLGEHAEPRPLNLDPGYLTLAKLVLASTKDHAHRIYLGEGIYAEVTLHYKHGAWQTAEWTFPDYRRAEYHRFFLRCREAYQQRLRQESAP